MKKIIPLFIFLFSCVNTGSSIKDSPSIKNVQKDKCEIISFFSSNQNKKIVKCNSGYSFQMPNEEIDSIKTLLEQRHIRSNKIIEDTVNAKEN